MFTADYLNLYLVRISVITKMFYIFQNIQHRTCKFISEFSLNIIKTDNLYVYRITNHIRHTIPKSVPVAPVIIGKIKFLFDYVVKLKIIVYICKIKRIQLFEFVHLLSSFLCYFVIS